VASAHERSTPGSENGRCLGRRGLPEANFALAVPAWHRTVHRTLFTVITVKYGVTITVVRCNLTSTVRTVQTVIVPYRTTQQACSCCCWGSSSTKSGAFQHARVWCICALAAKQAHAPFLLLLGVVKHKVRGSKAVDVLKVLDAKHAERL